MKKKLVTIGIPCYNEEENVELFYKKIISIIKEIKPYQFRILFVDNGSTDKTETKIKSLIKKDKKIIGIFLSRDFGPEASVQAVLNYAPGDALITLSCDFQDPPELIPKFINKWQQGYHMVAGIYTKSEDDKITAFLRQTFYLIFKKMSNIYIPVNASGVGLMDRKTIEALKSLPEKYRFFRGLKSWVGFKTAYITYERKKRQYGVSSYNNFFDYFKHAERGLFGFSYLPLDLMVYSGFILTLLSFVFVVGYLFTVLFFGNPIKASIPLLLSNIFFGGIQLFAISIIGKYIQVVVEETKARPSYIVKDIINLSTE